MAHPFHADHIGSLLRPQALLDARNDPHVTRGQLAAIEDRHILGVLKRQQDNDCIRRKLQDVPVANKTGALDALRSDVGIVYSKRGRIALICWRARRRI